MSPDTIPILYACVSKGPTVLAEIGAGDLRSLAARCLEAAPRFHRLYTRTTGGRIYAFLFEDPLIFFAIANEALGRPQALLFLRRLCDAFSSSALGRSRRIDGPDPLSPLCFQDEFLPVLRQLVLPLLLHEDKPPPPPSPSSPPSDAPLSSSTPSQPEGSRRGRKNKVKKKRSEEVESRVEISAAADDDDDPRLIGGRESPRRWWRRHLWRILLIDLVICCLLFGIWLSVCQGFECITS